MKNYSFKSRIKHFSLGLLVIILSSCNSSPNKKEAKNLTTEVYVLMGQSNMAGRGEIDSIANTYLSEKVLMLNKDNIVLKASHPLHFDKPKVTGVGPGIMFGSEMSKNTQNRILLVPCAIGGTAIKLWSPGAYDEVTYTHPYDDAIRRIKVAMNAGKIKGVIWHQGEADVRNANYLDELVELIERIRTVVNNPELPFIVGELGYFISYADVTEFNKNLHLLPQRIENVAVVSAEGTMHKGDKVHFDARSAELLGKRYSEAMEELQK